MTETDNNVSIQTDRVSEMTCSRCQSVLDVSGEEPFTEFNCPACAHKLTVPARFGAFLLVRLLGKGGMGAIYQGIDSELGRDVAIKVMLKSLGSDQNLVETFRREARMAAALNHPNVVQMYSSGQERGQPYIVMELVSGRTLDGIMGYTGPMLDALAIGIGVGVAKGLSAGFDIGLIHGDIKPKNIIVDLKGTAKVVDFGLATFVDKQASEQGGIWGTPYYIAPEKVLKQPVDARSDIYSLGATLYHAIAGVPPFDGPTPADVVKARLKGPPTPLSEVRTEVLPRTNSIVMRMLEDKPAKRYPTYLSLLGDLEGALEEAESNAGVATLQAAKNAMLKRSAASARPVKHMPGEGTLQSRAATAAQPADQSSAQPPRILINLKSRKSRAESAKPLETEEELEEKRKQQHATARRSRLLALTIAAVIILVGAATAAFFWQMAERKKHEQINKVFVRVDAVFQSMAAPATKLSSETRQARGTVIQLHNRYVAGGHTRSAELVAEALALYDAAVAEADKLDAIVARANEARSAAENSATPEFAAKNLESIQALPAVAEQLKEEIKKLHLKARALTAKAASAPAEEEPEAVAPRPKTKNQTDHIVQKPDKAQPATVESESTPKTNEAPAGKTGAGSD